MGGLTSLSQRNWGKDMGVTRSHPSGTASEVIVRTETVSVSSVTDINASLTPSSGTVSISDNKVVNGMLNGWKVSDPQSGIDGLTDDGNKFRISFLSCSGNAEWAHTSGVCEKQPILLYPKPVMGDFTFEVKFTGASSGAALRHIYVGTFTVPSNGAGDTPDWSHHMGARFGRWQSANGAPRAAFCTSAGSKSVTITAQAWDQDHWLKVQRSEETITMSHKYGSGSYAAITTGDKMDIGGGATNLGIGVMTTSGSGSEDYVDILSVSLTSHEWTASP